MNLFTHQCIYLYIYLYTLFLSTNFLPVKTSLQRLFPCSLIATFIFIIKFLFLFTPVSFISVIERSVYTSNGTVSNTFSFKMPVLTSSCPCPLTQGEQSSHLLGFLAYQTQVSSSASTGTSINLWRRSPENRVYEVSLRATELPRRTNKHKPNIKTQS